MPWLKRSIPAEESSLSPAVDLQVTIVSVPGEEPSLSMSETLARVRSSALHPSAAGAASVPRVVDIRRAHQPLSGQPAGAKYPRATVRPVPGLVAGKPMYVVKVWKDYCCPIEFDGQPIAVVGDSLAVAWTWAEARVDAARFWQEARDGD